MSERDGEVMGVRLMKCGDEGEGARARADDDDLERRAELDGGPLQPQQLDRRFARRRGKVVPGYVEYLQIRKRVPCRHRDEAWARISGGKLRFRARRRGSAL